MIKTRINAYHLNGPLPTASYSGRRLAFIRPRWPKCIPLPHRQRLNTRRIASKKGFDLKSLLCQFFSITWELQSHVLGGWTFTQKIVQKGLNHLELTVNLKISLQEMRIITRTFKTHHILLNADLWLERQY